MTGRPIAILDTSYLFHLARASATLGSAMPVEHFLQAYEVYIPDRIRTEIGDNMGLDPATQGDLIASISALINSA